MNAEATAAVESLSRKYLIEHPRRSARHLEKMLPEEAAEIISELDIATMTRIWHGFAPGFADQLLPYLADGIVAELLEKLDAGHAAALLGRLDETKQQHYLALLSKSVAHELQTLLSYPEDTAGSMMDTRILAFRPAATATDALKRLRARANLRTHQLKLVDEENRLIGVVFVNDLLLAAAEAALETLMKPVCAVVQPLDPRGEVVSKLEQFVLEEIPVVDLKGEFVGVIRHPALLEALKEQTVDAIGSMVGVSKDERALSSSWFAVKKRQPWLQINLLTAFLAASVVGLFEGTIAKVTALAVLLPVVAGQSGNSGSQALAVTMRGLALREFGLRQWFPVMRKEIGAGLLNGLGIAITCGIGVFIWSQKLGLVIVISSAMILAMIAAGIAGALVPVTLVRFGQDPAVASSIILTTVTDITGFFAFLGIASLLMPMLT
ncbi:MAG: magnesium transporter [Rhodospirillales bacterium]